MLELLLSGLCIAPISTDSCSDAARAYASQKYVKVQLKHAKKKATRILGPTIMYTLPAATSLMQGRYEARIAPNIYLQVRDSQSILIYKLSF